MIAVIIPCFRVKTHILEVLNGIGPEVDEIYVVDDGCPEGSGKYVEENSKDPRLSVLYNQKNMGVGGAVKAGYLAALKGPCSIFVKLDGDGQMDPKFISNIVHPIQIADADYTKGNRFFNLEGLREMPGIRLFGNAILSFLTKLSSGYWDIFDPTNGYTAIHRDALVLLALPKIANRYFFESDMLFRLNIIRAVVVDVPMEAHYDNEKSGLNIITVIPTFVLKHIVNFSKRIFYSYYLRDMNIGSFYLPLAVFFLSVGLVNGFSSWRFYASTAAQAPSGLVVLPALFVIIGMQLILSFLSIDIEMRPKKPIHRFKKPEKKRQT